MDARRAIDQIAAGHRGGHATTGLHLGEGDDGERAALLGSADTKAMARQDAHRVLLEPDQQFAAARRGECRFGDRDIGEIVAGHGSEQFGAGSAEAPELRRKLPQVGGDDFGKGVVAGEVGRSRPVWGEKDGAGNARLTTRESRDIVARAREHPMAAPHAEPAQAQIAAHGLPQDEQCENHEKYTSGASAERKRCCACGVLRETRRRAEAEDECKRCAGILPPGPELVAGERWRRARKQRPQGEREAEHRQKDQEAEIKRKTADVHGRDFPPTGGQHGMVARQVKWQAEAQLVAGLAGSVRAWAWRLCALIVLGATGALAADNPFLPAQDPAPLLAAIAREQPAFVPPAGVTGITVPHHLLAADLIARGFWAASAGHYKRIILISPDHFRRVQKPFGTTRENLLTVFGPVPSDSAGVSALVAHDDLVQVLPTVNYEHGLMAEAPFIRHFFPDAQVIPLLGSINAGEADWRAMVELLKPLVTPDTLIVQSTDFSHYRPLAEAMARDQESIAMIEAEDPDGVAPLLQPSHMDSKAATYVQMALQRELFHAHPVVIGNGNSVEYGTGAGSTTSYVVVAYMKDPAAGTVFDYSDQTKILFGGDVLLGRYFLPALHDPVAWTRIRDAVLAVTRRTPLIVNLEGVLLDGPVSGVGPDAHVMNAEDAAPVLAALNVVAASLANNHANDLGPEGRAESAAQLRALGIAPLGHGTVTDMGAFRVLAVNFVGGKMVEEAIADPARLDWVCGLKAAPPLVAFVHWGAEYTSTATDAERKIAEGLARCGVTLVVGDHSHQASTTIEPVNGGASQMLFSLGNFLFDQTSPRGSGALLELRVFRQGTVAARLVPIPNLFELGR